MGSHHAGSSLEVRHSVHDSLPVLTESCCKSSFQLPLSLDAPGSLHLLSSQTHKKFPIYNQGIFFIINGGNGLKMHLELIALHVQETEHHLDFDNPEILSKC